MLRLWYGNFVFHSFLTVSLLTLEGNASFLHILKMALICLTLSLRGYFYFNQNWMELGRWMWLNSKFYSHFILLRKCSHFLMNGWLTNSFRKSSLPSLSLGSLTSVYLMKSWNSLGISSFKPPCLSWVIRSEDLAPYPLLMSGKITG
jgi:hypothetical protein